MTNVTQDANLKTRSFAPRRRGLSREATERSMNIVSPLALLLLWELCARAGFIDVRFFPAPSKVFQVMYNMIQNGQLEKHVWASLQRLFWGIIFGGGLRRCGRGRLGPCGGGRRGLRLGDLHWRCLRLCGGAESRAASHRHPG